MRQRHTSPPPRNRRNRDDPQDVPIRRSPERERTTDMPLHDLADEVTDEEDDPPPDRVDD